MTWVQANTRMTGWWRSSRYFDAKDLTIAGGLMLVAAFLRPLVPFESGIACPLRAMTGIPCPFCGMTTSVSATVQLDVVEAFAANPAGIIATLFAVFLIVRRPRYLKASLPMIGVSLLVMWIFELNRYGFI